MDAFGYILAHLMTWLFVAGMAGCVIMIPVVAFRLFSVLFERDQPGER